MSRTPKRWLAAFAAWLICSSIILPSRLAAQQTADLILRNGKVLTVDSKFSVAEALAVSGNKISAVGANADVMKLTGPNTQVIDLKGKTVIPGLIDTHLHTYSIAESAYGSEVSPDKRNRLPIDWRAVRDKNDVLLQIKANIDKYKIKPGQWLYFQNENLSFGTTERAQAMRKLLYDQMTRWDLDTVSPNNPIMLDMGVPDTSGFFVNSKAFDYVMNKYGDFVKKYGRLWLDANGKPDGHLEPPANRLLFPQEHNRAPEVLAPLFKKEAEELIASGMTAFSSRFSQETIDAYGLLEKQGELNLRIGYGLENFSIVTNLDDMKMWATKIGTGTDKLWITSMGGEAIDGATSRTCMSVPRTGGSYDPVLDGYWPMGACNVDTEYHGAAGKSARTPGNYFRDWMIASGKYGVRFANTHVSGERSIKLLLNIAEQAVKERGPDAAKGWAFDHCVFVDPADLPRIAKLDMFFSCAPMYAVDNAPNAIRAYGEKVGTSWVSPIKSMLNAGIRVAYEGDRDRYVWSELEMLITRKDKAGKVWSPHERINRTEALKMITIMAADYMLRKDQFGSLEPGKLADIVVLDKDYMAIPEDEIHTIEPQFTVFDGKIVAVHPKFVEEYNIKPAGALVGSYQDLVARRPNKSGGFGRD
jgi:predicted amidohydrolase YtcJ